MKLRAIMLWASLALALGTVNWLALGRERLAADGHVMYLDLAPVDPRSLMQGDYMDLRYALADRVPINESAAAGALVVRVDELHYATFVRVHTPGAPLAPGEHLLRYRVRDGRALIGAESFFFQEGQAERFAAARYGELRVAPDGTAALVGLRGDQLEPLGR
ncbi:MAG TPA: GDYXXLXY domain-containing protein [Herpetosiphonaceae bacterium]|nr:GDYXXLXY domain-containing protein [Herpetosiphonaceae bacterium]